jgi:hypothetical protein
MPIDVGPSRPVRQQIVEPDGSTVDIVATRVQPRVGVIERRATRPLGIPVVYFAIVDPSVRLFTS